MNYMKQVAQMLGVELGEEFKIKGREDTFRFNECRLLCHLKGNEWYECDEVLVDLLFGEEKIQKPILDKKEKEYLSYVIKPFRDKIKCLYKTKNEDSEYIEFKFNDAYDFMCFPNFEKGTMYKGMELVKKYTLEDLDL